MQDYHFPNCRIQTLKGEGEGEGEGKTGKGKGVPPLQKLICLYFTYLKSAVYELQAVVF